METAVRDDAVERGQVADRGPRGQSEAEAAGRKRGGVPRPAAESAMIGPEHPSAMAAPLRFERLVLVSGATPEALWPLVSDTDRLNRAVGLPPPFYTAIPRPEGGSRTLAAYRLGPLALARWEEMPFQWQYPRTYWVERVYHGGPIRTFRGGADLTPTAGGATAIRIWADIVPRGPFGQALVRFAVGPGGVTAAARQCEVFARYLRGELDDPFPQLRHRYGWTWLADRLFQARPPAADSTPCPSRQRERDATPCSWKHGATPGPGSAGYVAPGAGFLPPRRVRSMVSRATTRSRSSTGALCSWQRTRTRRRSESWKRNRCRQPPQSSRCRRTCATSSSESSRSR